jgi:DNA-binding response OmpR family regulator
MDARILLVEDQTALQTLLQQRLEGAGWDVCVADSVAKGLALLERQAFDLLILDAELPDGRGDALVAVARAHPARPGVIWISADRPPAADLWAGCHSLPKPFDVRDLVRLAQNALNLRAAGAGTSERPQPGDTRLADEVRAVLRINSILRGVAPIEVEVAGGIVTLRGVVASEAQQRAASKAALRLPGVRLVINRIRLASAAEPQPG